MMMLLLVVTVAFIVLSAAYYYLYSSRDKQLSQKIGYYKNVRLPSAPLQRRSIKQTKQTIVTECVETGEDNDSGSWLEPTIVTEVRTSSVTFPPNCCVSAYEEFLSAFNAPPPIPPGVLPTIIDECDPCAEVPRQISPFEDVENITHSCGTQTLDEEDLEESPSQLMREICNSRGIP